ncbi:acyl-ACP desaturase [Nocardia sp. NPDC003345]
MTRELTQLELLMELEPVAEDGLNRHLSMAGDWHPHDYIPWDEGRNFAALGGRDWEPGQSRLGTAAEAAMITGLLAEDNLPAYHRLISENFSENGAWGTWVGRWTAEENRHAIVIRDYLVVTRGVDPVALERARMAHMCSGLDNPPDWSGLLENAAFMTFQEMSAGVSHRDTGALCADTTADRILRRVAADEDLHVIFYRGLCDAALDLVPDQAIRAIGRALAALRAPGAATPGAADGLHDPRRLLTEVIDPVLAEWRIFDRGDFGPEGERRREAVAVLREDLAAESGRYEDRRTQIIEPV